MKKKKKKTALDIYIKASRKGAREAELENSTGFKSITKIHKSKKIYDRKNNKNIDDHE